LSGIQHPDDKNTEDISLNRPTKGGETGVASNSHITGFQADGLKKWERKLPRHFPNHAPKKVVKALKVVFRTEKNCCHHPHRFRHLHRLFSGRFKKIVSFWSPSPQSTARKMAPASSWSSAYSLNR
jgi:hypothetical protein